MSDRTREIRVRPYVQRRRKQGRVVAIGADDTVDVEWYIRGVNRFGNVTSGVLVAKEKEQARENFRLLHPDFEIVQLNERGK